MDGLRAYILGDLWDLEALGFEPALDRVQNNLGASGLGVRLDPPPALRLRPRAGDAPALYRNTGGLWFRAAADRYERTRLKAMPAPEMRGRDPFAKLAAHCAGRGFPLRVWIEGCHNPLAAARHPEMAVKDVFGHVSQDWLCPHNPDVAAYLHALVADVCAAHPLDALVLASAGPQPADSVLAGVEAGIAWGPVERLLFGMCFCESSQQRAAEADVEIQAAARITRQLVADRLNCDPAANPDPAALLEANPVLEQLDRWRRQEADRLIESLARGADTAVVLHECVPRDQGHLPCDRLLVTCRDPSPPGMEERIRQGAESAGGLENLELLFEVRPGLFDTSQTLVSAVAHAAELGVSSMSLGNFSLWPEPRFNWVRQALRNARRIYSSA